MKPTDGARRHEAVGPDPRTDASSGQATVEAALLLPFIAFVLLALVQVGLLVRSRILVTHAARQGARVAAVGGSDLDTRRAVEAAGDLPVHRIRVEVDRSDGVASVVVTYNDPTDVPLVGSLIGDAEMMATARMMIETP